MSSFPITSKHPLCKPVNNVIGAPASISKTWEAAKSRDKINLVVHEHIWESGGNAGVRFRQLNVPNIGKALGAQQLLHHLRRDTGDRVLFEANRG